MTGTATIATEADRLWPALSRPTVRRMPPKSWDVLGERVRGWAARRRSHRADRRRAEMIAQRAGELAPLSESALNEAIDLARQRVILNRDQPAAIDEAFAVGHEIVRRETGLTLHVEQVMGVLAMAEGCCAEMATGEGKTITAVLPAALDGWCGRGVHVLTVNDYLARRDAQITGPSYRRLGLSVGVIQEGSTPDDRREAYLRDITYAADKQVIFDHLRDRLASPLNPRLASHLLDHLSAGPWSDRRADWSGRVVQRGLHAAIVDEADSILIDDAITPAIIGRDVPAGCPGSASEQYKIAADIARGLVEDEHYTVDRHLRQVRLTDAGKDRLAELSDRLPPFWAGRHRREELLVQALSAKELYERDDEYVIKDGQIVIVDRSTGRLLEGRQWQLGVHQAVEAKEGLDATQDRTTVARTSYQRFFQRYHRLSGMTGTAWEVRYELWRDYRLPVARVPTHRPVIRVHERDRVFLREQDKLEAAAARVASFHESGQPVLVGTWSVASSERLGQMLAERGIACRILNALREAEEARIVAEAGRKGAVTVATNMAGRGTDIVLDDETRQLGGLVVLATERHDEARVDRQLAGRAGRQGDPGLAVAYVSLDDSLIERQGLVPLVWLCRRTGGNRIIARALWWLAQWSASRKAASSRAEVAKADAWLEMAMHHHTR